MRLRAGWLVIAAAGLPAVLAAQTKPAASPAAPAAPAAAAPAAAAPAAQASPLVIERITLDDLKKAIAADTVLVVDVRGAEAYREGHIPGSISAPLAELDKHLDTLKAAKKPIVTYCS